MSLGAKGNIATSPVCLAIKDITDAGTIVVAAAGNSNIDTSRFVPGGCSESITVGAVDENNTRATFSNYGEKVDVAAPGVGIYSTYLHDGYKSLNGTSMATPHIVGIVSILKTFQPELTTHEIKELLKNNALPVQTEDNKKIASQVDLEKILTSFGLNPSQKIENEILEAKKEIEEIPKENQPEVSTQTGSEKQSESSGPENTQETFILEDNALIDESVGLVIQNTEEETTKINSAENEQQDLVSDENNESSSQINDINLNGGESQTEQIEINNIEEETIQDVLEENSSEELEESDITGIQNSYTCSFNIGGSCSLSLANANNKNIYNYSAKTSGLTYSTNSSKLTIYGNKVGTINFYVNKYNTSKRKYELLHTIVVTVTDPIKILKATMGTTTFQKNESTSINVTSGNGGYSVTSSNTSVAQISGSNTSWIVKGVGIGNTTITIKDSKGKSGTWNITVTPRNLTLSTYSLDVDKGVNGIINITDGNGGYSIVKKNNDISVNLSGTRITVYSTVVGIHTIQVKDSAGKVVSLSVSVKLSPLQEVQESYWILQIMANNGWWGDGYINEYKGKTRAQIEDQANIFVQKLFTYKMNYDTSFKNAYNTEVIKELNAYGGVKSDIEKGLKDGITEGTKDYLMSYYDAVKSLSNLSFDSVTNGVGKVWSFVTNPVSSLSSLYNGFKDTITGIYEALLGLSGYEYAKGGSYVGINISLSAVDPTGKVINMMGGGFFVRIIGKKEEIETAIYVAGKYKAFDKNNYRHNLIVLKGTGKGSKLKDGYVITNPQAHHIFPQTMRNRFLIKGINIDDPKYLVWVESKSGYAFNHQKWSSEYNTLIETKFDQLEKNLVDGKITKDGFRKQFEDFAKQEGVKLNYNVNY